MARRLLHIIKLVTISCLSRQKGKLIEECDIERAKGWLLEAEKVMPDIFRAMMAKSDSELLSELHFHLWKLWASVVPDKRKPIDETHVYTFLKDRVPGEKIAKIIEVAEKSGLIVHNAGGGWIPRPLHT